MNKMCTNRGSSNFLKALLGKGKDTRKKHTARCDTLIWAKMTDFWLENGFEAKNALKKR